LKELLAAGGSAKYGEQDHPSSSGDWSPAERQGSRIMGMVDGSDAVKQGGQLSAGPMGESGPPGTPAAVGTTPLVRALDMLMSMKQRIGK
jgi:hypothetical protein